MCVVDPSAPCNVADLVVPDGAAVSTEQCSTSSEVPSGLSCEFGRAGFVCSGAECLAGSWGTGTCVEMPSPPPPPGCMMEDLVLPEEEEMEVLPLLEEEMEVLPLPEDEEMEDRLRATRP